MQVVSVNVNPIEVSFLFKCTKTSVCLFSQMLWILESHCIQHISPWATSSSYQKVDSNNWMRLMIDEEMREKVDPWIISQTALSVYA
jgi:hypothetical protein